MGFLPLATGISATNGKPTGATAGVAVRPHADGSKTGYGLHDAAESALLLLWSTDVDAEVKTATVRLWGYIGKIGHGENALTINDWFPIGTGVDSTKGTINGVAAAGETDTDEVRHCEIVTNLAYFERLYAEFTAVTGTFSIALLGSRRRS